MSKGTPYGFETKTLKKVSNPADLPINGFIIQIFDQYSIYHEGDERSRTNPGHGYPAYTETVEAIYQYVTHDHEEWKKKIADLYEEDRNRKDVVALSYTKASIESKVQVVIK